MSLVTSTPTKSTGRASFYFYNTQADVDRFVEAMKEIQKFFGQ
jgi:selenocysteine lyase/cysteine desulfurase